MAVLNGSNATESFDMVDLNEIDFASEDAAGTNSSTQYSWLTTNAHDVQTTGSGITFSGGAPTGGTITAIDIDLSNNNFATPDIAITGVNSVSLVTITNTSVDFLNTVFGGDDTMTGTPFADALKGVGGDDSIDGGAGGDTIFGGAGADTLVGGDGSDSLLGEAGADNLSDDIVGNDTLSGGDDDDVITMVSSIAFDSMDGGAGNDWIDWSTSTQNGATFDLAAGTAVSGANSETMTNFEHLKGTGGADSISGTTAANYLIGNGGNDTLDGLDGDDTLEGNDGDDNINDAAGSDLMSGGAGDDTFVEADIGGVDTISGGSDDDYVFVGSSIGSDSFAGDAGIDTIDWSLSSQSGGTFNLAAGTASVGAFTETMTNFENLKGTGGADTIVGSANLNDLYGLGGNDSISGGASADTITGGAGNDTLDGGTAFDTVSYSDKSAGVNVNVINGVALTGGFVNSAGFYQGGAQEDTISNFENIFGTDYSDRLIAGSTSAVINGEDGNDYLYTFSGNDTLYGGNGNDYISGAKSTDQLFGEAGKSPIQNCYFACHALASRLEMRRIEAM